MNIRLAYDFDLYSLKELFPEIELLDIKRDKNLAIDLLIFPGGEDVSLEYYLPLDEAEAFLPLCHVNKERDGYEDNILAMSMSEKLNVKKILGICRGAQFLNVKFGGTLFPDLAAAGLQHPPYHEITHILKNNLSFFSVVNSLHHQGINKCGNYYSHLDFYVKPVQIARDNSGYVTEIISWLNGKVLGLQFHPEYYNNNNPDKIKFKEFIHDWVLEKRFIYE